MQEIRPCARTYRSSDHRSVTPLRTGNDARTSARRRAEIDAASGPRYPASFFMVTGHGVPADLITKARQRAIESSSCPTTRRRRRSGRRRRSAVSTTAWRTRAITIRWDRHAAGHPRRRSASTSGPRPTWRRKRYPVQRPNVGAETSGRSNRTISAQAMVSYYHAMVGWRRMCSARDGDGASALSSKITFADKFRSPGERVPHHPLSGGDVKPTPLPGATKCRHVH